VSEFTYVARADIARLDGTHRRATLEDGTAVEFGVHGAVKSYYRLDNEKNLPLPVDYIVAATGG
jgi:hypothetical protein